MAQEFEFDVAISFRNPDLQLALQIADQLKPALKVFVYSRQQETVAATDGLDSFRSVFRSRARISVVLLRDGWGKTPWTGVEEVAIKDRCLQTKYRNLVVVRLDDSETPEWIPDTHIHFDMKSYSMAELVGIIKAKAVESGADLKVPSLADKAEALHKRREFDAETRRLLENSAQSFNEAFAELKESIKQAVGEVADRTGWTFHCGEPAALIGGFVIATHGRTLQIVPSGLYVNTAREACLYVREYSVEIPVQEPGKSYSTWQKLDFHGNLPLEVERTVDLGWCWHFQGRTRSIADTADEIVGVLLASIEKHSD